MGPLIHLAAPTPAGLDAARLDYSVGRSLTAADFGLQKRYVDARLLGLTPAATGVITGLGISPPRFDSPNGATGLTSLTIGTGSGLGADGRLVRVTTPITLLWADLVKAVTDGATTLANGFYFLLVRTAIFDGLEGPPPDPSQRTDPDPLLDIREDSFVEPWLSTSVGALPAARTPAGLALAVNTLVGGLTQERLVAAIGNGIPLALVLVLNNQAIMLSQAAGRLPATPTALNGLLLAQVREAFAMALAESGANPASAGWQTATRARFSFLPGAGELPLGLLLSPETVTANCPFFPPGVGVNLQAIRASQAPHLLQQALGRSPLNLTTSTAQAVTLALAIPDAAWTPALLDIPRGDPVLAADLHFAYARARAAQIVAREQWIALYGGMTAVVAAQPQAVGFLTDADAAARNLTYLLRAATLNAAELLAGADGASSSSTLMSWVTARLAALTAAQTATPPPPAPVPSNDAAAVTAQLSALGYKVLDAEPAQADPSITPHAPVASDTVLAPLLPSLPANSDFAHWSAAITSTTADPDLLQPLIDSGIPGADDPNQDTRINQLTAFLGLPASNDPRNDDTQPGALIQLTLLQLFYAVFVRVARSYEQMLEAHSRLIALQRQHLDIMSTSVSALAGGIPSDASGLSFSRLIPFVSLTSPAAPAPAATAAPAAAPTNTAPVTAVRTFSATASATLTQPSVARITSVTEAVRLGPASGVTAVPEDIERGSIIGRTGISGTAAAAPVLSPVGSVLGTGADVARQVATDIGTISQSPTFAYQPVQYGTAAHITPAVTLLQHALNGVSALRDLAKDPLINISLTAPTPTSITATEPLAYSGIVETTRVLLGDINLVETNALGIERAYFQFRDRIASLQTRIGQLSDALAGARDTLRSAQVTAAQTAGDYVAAQRLVQEEAARVATAVAARHQAMTAATGLFYVRELQTLTTRPLPPAMALTADTPADLVPGCAADHGGPPAAVQPFLDLLLEVPLSNWTVLQGGWVDLPNIAGLQRLGVVRTTRLASVAAPAAFGAGAAAADLAALAGMTHSAFAPLFQSGISIASSLAVSQQRAFEVLALHDIVTLPFNRLRSNAEAMRARMESAAGCLFETLSGFAPSTRFVWATLARARNLPALSFTEWPVPSALSASDAVTLRRLSALVNWMAGQLHSSSSAASQTALSNLVLATVMAAAYGDPSEAVTGTVATGGGVPRPGVPIRVILNRPPPIGTVLNLLDDTQTIIGTLRVEDHDDLGTTASVLTSFAQTAPTSGWSVTAPRAHTPWLLS